MLKGSTTLGTRFFSVLSSVHLNPIVHEVHGIIKWVRPQKLKSWEPERTLDLKPLPDIDPNWLQLEYRPFASIINELPPEKRKLFTVGLGRRRHAIEVIMEDTLDSIRRHKYDTESYEYTIGSLTVKVRNLQYLLTTDEVLRRHPGLRKACFEMANKRRKYLNRLKNLDYKRFEWLLYSLNILYKPTPPVDDYVTRKESMRKLTDIYCQAIKQRKIDAYKAELESQKIPFLEEKLATLHQIKNDEEFMRIPTSVDEEIEKTIQHLERVKNSHIVLEPVPENQPQIESKS